MLEKVWIKGTLLHCWWKQKLMQPLWRMRWKFLRKLRMEILYDPVILLLGRYSKKTNLKDICTLMFTAALFTTAKLWEQPNAHRQINDKKLWSIPVCMHVLSRSVVSDSLWPHGLQPTKLLCPWNFPSKNTEVGCHFPLQRILYLVTKKNEIIPFAATWMDH